MLTYGQAILLGVIQGLTEFLPVSSSGHLVLGRALLGLEMPGLTLEIMLHVGTALAVALVFRADLARMVRAVLHPRRGDPDLALLWLLVLASVPAALVGVFLGGFVEQRLASPRIAGGLLLVTAAVLLFGPPRAALPGRRSGSRRLRQKRAQDADSSEPWATKAHAGRRALLVGVAQAVAILPGISRSGSSLVASMRAGIPRQQAVRFALLLSLPVIFGSAAADLADLAKSGRDLAALPWGPLLAGVATAFVAGLAAIRMLLAAVQRARLTWFGVYCLVAGIVALIVV